jgi:ATP-binding cassette subfamily F protein 3
LDLASKEVLKQALQKYDGTMLVVSHDRDFLNGLTDIVYEIKPDRMRIWEGDVLDFLKEKKAESIAEFERNKVVTKAAKTEQSVGPAPVVEKIVESAPEAALSRDELKELEKQKKKQQQAIQKVEKDISDKEAEIAKMDEVIAQLDYTDQEKSNKILADYAILKKQLDELFAKWEEVQVG